MNKDLLVSLKKRLQSILSFVTSPSENNAFVYHDLISDTKTKFTSLQGFPCEFFLLVSDKHLCRKVQVEGQTRTDKTCLNPDINLFLNNSNVLWEQFTGDHAHPVPNRFNADLQYYNAGLIDSHRKAEGSLWLKEMGQVRIAYLNHLLSQVDLYLQEIPDD